MATFGEPAPMVPMHIFEAAEACDDPAFGGLQHMWAEENAIHFMSVMGLPALAALPSLGAGGNGSNWMPNGGNNDAAADDATPQQLASSSTIPFHAGASAAPAGENDVDDDDDGSDSWWPGCDDENVTTTENGAHQHTATPADALVENLQGLWQGLVATGTSRALLPGPVRRRRSSAPSAPAASQFLPVPPDDLTNLAVLHGFGRALDASAESYDYAEDGNVSRWLR